MAQAPVPPPPPPAASTAAPPAPGAAPPAAATETPVTPGTAPDTQPSPPPAATAPQAQPEEEEEVEEEAPKPRRRKGGRVRWRSGGADSETYEREQEDRDREDRDREEEERAAGATAFSIADSRFLLSVERVTGVQSWSRTTDTPAQLGFDVSEGEVEASGTDVSFLGGGAAGGINPFAIPRVAFDARLEVGLTLGGSLGYMSSTGEETATAAGLSATAQLPEQSVFVINPRIGVLFEASPSIGIWLRGGISRFSISSSSTSEEVSAERTLTFTNFTLDPQLVLMPVPHVGIALGALLDIGVGGEAEATLTADGLTETATLETKASAYGVTAGLTALF